MCNDEEFQRGYVKWFTDIPERHNYPYIAIFSVGKASQELQDAFRVSVETKELTVHPAAGNKHVWASLTDNQCDGSFKENEATWSIS